jgi:predicted phosphodiesterase
MLLNLSSLAPLFEGADRIVLNGDTLDTRPSPWPDFTRELRGKVAEFFGRSSPPAIFLTGNHDPDISDQHTVELGNRCVYVTHGDILYEDLVPWSRDARLLRERVATGLAQLPSNTRDQLSQRFAVHRRAAISLSQRHQSERNTLKYAIGFAADTVWPPTRFLHILRAWREAPQRAAELLNKENSPARVFVMGHTHRLGATRGPNGLVVLNTGSLCPPCIAGVVDVCEDHATLRRIERRGREFALGATLAKIALAEDATPATLRP